jgi:hypothetical protein
MIINRLDSGTTFATTVVGNEQIFVPGKIASLLNVQVGERYSAILIENTAHPEKTPWMAIHLDRLNAASQPASHDKVAIAILNDLNENGSATINEMADSLDLPMPVVLSKMQEMARGGMIFRRTMYAINEADFDRGDE